MQTHNLAETLYTTPSVTMWTRLEPLAREASMQRSLQAQVRDPLWFLARQYQMGEFLGDDAGSPIHASMLAEFRNVTTYRPGDDNSKAVRIDSSLPVEVHVERESVCLRLRGSVQLGLYFEALIRQKVSNPDGVINLFRNAFPIDSVPPDPLYAPPDAAHFRSLVAKRVTDGEALYRSAAAIACNQIPPKPLPDGSNTSQIQDVINDFLKYRQSLITEPSKDSAWQSSKLDYDFALGSPDEDQNLLVVADDFRGGHLDWFSFSLEKAQPDSVSAHNLAVIDSKTFDLLPNHVVFRGMPDSRWWNFEDGTTDFGQLDADHVDLPKLLVMEFALVFGNDWFSIPVPVKIAPQKQSSNAQGTLSRITSLVITDTFGVRTLIRPAEQTNVNTGESPWSMYKLSAKDARSDYILMAPTLGLVQDAGALEEVLFLRDDMAAMAWAVEQQLQSDLDLPVDAYQAFLQSIQGKEDPAPLFTPGGPDIYYSIEKLPPYNWVPMVPVLSNHGAPFLRRGALQVPDHNNPSQVIKLKAHALILEPGVPFFVVDHAVPRSGIRVNRNFRFTRSFYGTSFLWLARKSGLGRGPGWSGLRFDSVHNIPKKAAA